MASIELQNVSKRYSDGTEAVREVDLSIADGEIMILVGPSGCGKSTALRMIAGLEGITDGELLIDGERVNELAPGDRDVAMVFQNYALYPHMTVRENMGFALKLAKVKRDEIRRKVDDAAQILGLSDHLERKPARLSGGQRQRVAMGRAIVREPRAFLMDEPLSNLDAKLRVEMRMSVAQMQRDLGATTVYVTHDQTEAMTLGDRVAVLRRGVVQQVDTPQTLYEDPANLFVAGFIGSPSINLIPATLEGDAIALPFGKVPLPRRADCSRTTVRAPGAGATEVIAGLRPEHVEDAAFANGQPHQVRFRARIAAVEATGPELYAYFQMPARTPARALAHLAGAVETDAALSAGHTTARLNPASGARAGEDVELVLDAAEILLFDPDSGARLW